MRTNIVVLAALAGLGVPGFVAMPAQAENLSCITDTSTGEQRLLRDCEREPEEAYVVIEVPSQPPPPTTPPPELFFKHGEGGKGGGPGGRSNDRDAPAAGGGNPNGPL